MRNVRKTCNTIYIHNSFSGIYGLRDNGLTAASVAAAGTFLRPVGDGIYDCSASHDRMQGYGHERAAAAVRPEPEIVYDDPETGNDSVPPSNCDRFTFVLYVFVLGALCVFGLVGNTLAFLVLRSERRGHVATFLLQTMAVADNVFLTTTALSQMTMALTLYADTTNVDHGPLNDLYTVTAYVQVRLPTDDFISFL